MPGIEEDILNGAFDDSLDSMIDAIHLRKRHLGDAQVVGVRPNDLVELDPSEIRPTYLGGLIVRVVKVNPKSITVQIPNHPDLRRYSGMVVRVPNALVRKVPS